MHSKPIAGNARKKYFLVDIVLNFKEVFRIVKNVS